MKFSGIWILLCLTSPVFSQHMDPDLQEVRDRLDSIRSFSADLQLDLDVDFINMPTKKAKVFFEQGKPLKFEGEDFLMIPRRGLDFSMQEIFRYPSLIVDRTTEEQSRQGIRTLSVIPNDPQSDLALATLSLDTRARRILNAEMTTRQEGTYRMIYQYGDEKIALPSGIEVLFELDRLKIPLNFMGKDTEMDRKAMKAEGKKSGRIFLKLDNYEVQVR